MWDPSHPPSIVNNAQKEHINSQDDEEIQNWLTFRTEYVHFKCYFSLCARLFLAQSFS